MHRAFVVKNLAIRLRVHWQRLTDKTAGSNLPGMIHLKDGLVLIKCRYRLLVLTSNCIAQCGLSWHCHVQHAKLAVISKALLLLKGQQRVSSCSRQVSCSPCYVFIDGCGGVAWVSLACSSQAQLIQLNVLHPVALGQAGQGDALHLHSTPQPETCTQLGQVL